MASAGGYGRVALFQSPSPFPEKYDLPILNTQRNRRHRRLGESYVSYEEAAAVCSRWSGQRMEDCINDVLISEDLEMDDFWSI